MTIENINDMIELITSLDTNTKTLEGFNDAVLGYDVQTKFTRVAYSVNKIIDILQNEKGMEFMDACQYFDKEVVKTHQGEGSPLFIYSNNKNIK